MATEKNTKRYWREMVWLSASKYAAMDNKGGRRFWRTCFYDALRRLVFAGDDNAHTLYLAR